MSPQVENGSPELRADRRIGGSGEHSSSFQDRKSHLQLLFERLDEENGDGLTHSGVTRFVPFQDDSGELSIDEMIAFIES